jgi:hypothetical protein
MSCRTTHRIRGRPLLYPIPSRKTFAHHSNNLHHNAFEYTQSYPALSTYIKPPSHLTSPLGPSTHCIIPAFPSTYIRPHFGLCITVAIAGGSCALILGSTYRRLDFGFAASLLKIPLLLVPFSLLLLELEMHAR